MNNGHEIRFAYALWGLAWIIIGIYDEALAEDWCTKYFVSLITLAVFSLWVGYELAFIKFVKVRDTLIYFTFMGLGINNWNVSFFFMAVLHRPGFLEQEYIWLAPNIVVPFQFYTSVTFTLFTLWMAFGVLMNVRKNLVEVYRIYYTYYNI